MRVLTRDEILSADDLRSERVEVPEWGEGAVVIVRELTGEQRDEYESSMTKINGTKVTLDQRNLRAKLVALSIVNEDGEPMFTLKDVDRLGRKSATAIDRIFGVAKRLSKVSQEDIDDLGKTYAGADSGASATL